MGRRSINTTKSGKYMNPTDQASKYIDIELRSIAVLFPNFIAPGQRLYARIIVDNQALPLQ